MSLSAAFNSLKSSNLISWKTTGKFQQTLAGCIELAGKTLHTGKVSKVKVCPGFAGEGRYFEFQSKLIPASIDFARESPLCTTLCKDGYKIRTVEHLLSALEAKGIDNCIIQIQSLDSEDSEVEVPIFDGSASAWVEAIEQVGQKEALDRCGNNLEKLAPYLNEPLHVLRNDSFIVGLPSSEVRITCGIDFPKMPAIGCQWFSSSFSDDFYEKHIACSRTFCIYEEVEHMRSAGLIKGGSLENAIVCSATKGWLNPPLRFHDEPCRHKILDLMGDLSLFARPGRQGFPAAHIVSFKGGHSLNANFVRRLSGINVEGSQ
ncbi:putative N-acetylglucosamine deacetylase 1 [Hibiscus syriacus]|uniref:UDP-3-O-acyl-N-acetylglucosamine deacetylase n=1 Tax=Hibiscus syriacus TaxID=106335 RepID=A0A6A3A4A1_HIBSY|nr:probable UDP-3-O-acyl-N-acetylglucosamine deacetylase 1, mitochondrial [Hibiscus syriacus]KAE8699028.1 putative N-acetylglucosamine deacetylase 1 [Hibiscus syriacus]